MVGSQFGIECDVPGNDFACRVEFGAGDGFKTAGFEMANALNQDVLSPARVDFLDLHQFDQGPRGGGDVLKVKGDSKQVVTVASAGFRGFQFFHKLPVAWLEDVQAGCSPERGNAQGEQRKVEGVRPMTLR